MIAIINIKKIQKMPEENKNQVDNQADLENSLESVDTVVEQNAPIAANSLINEDRVQTNQPEKVNKFSKKFHPKNIFQKINIYLLIFIVILLGSGFAAYVIYNSNKQELTSELLGQQLTSEDLARINQSDSVVGDPQKTLTIASNAIFNGAVLVKDNLDVAGSIKIGGSLSLSGITVDGTSAFEDLQVANNTAIAGNASVEGALAVQRSLSVAGDVNVGGVLSAQTINTERFVINNDLQINRHIDAGGQTPNISRGGAVGASGTTSLSGTDTAGTIGINFGAGSSPGVIANISFRNAFNQVPHVVVSPTGLSCAGLNYYVTKTTRGFSLATTNAGTPGTNCSFDYIVID